MSVSRIKTADMRAFEASFDATYEDIAAQTRGEFLKAFPLNTLKKLELNDYVVGLQKPTFCTHVEVKTRPWATIQGATAKKFGIYFGKTKSDPIKKYRFADRFGKTETEAFSAVKNALVELVKLGQAESLDFEQIDKNPLSQMFKAKILSLYFPDRFLNVCSADHLADLGEELGLPAGLRSSQYQNSLVKAKLDNPTTSSWSNPKFMSFLYWKYINQDSVAEQQVPKKPANETHRKVNFEDVQAQRDRIGKAAEQFALEWEKQRLEGIGLTELVAKIEDLRDRPAYGYDIRSHSSVKVPRYIEVKAVGKLSGGQGYRFFLSDNEHQVSLSREHSEQYFFYLVCFNSDGEPFELHPVRADKLYSQCEMLPASYVVRFDL